MNSISMRRVVFLVLGLVSLLIAGVYTYSGWRIETAHFGRTPNDVQRLGRTIDNLATQGRQGILPSRKVDYTSLGFKVKESDLLWLRRAISIFEASRHRVPERLDELTQLSYPVGEKDILQRLVMDCQMIVFEQDSYLLNCDHWTKPVIDGDFSALLSSFDTETERFYRVQEHLLLYIPPTKNRDRSVPAGR